MFQAIGQLVIRGPVHCSISKISLSRHWSLFPSLLPALGTLPSPPKFQSRVPSLKLAPKSHPQLSSFLPRAGIQTLSSTQLLPSTSRDPNPCSSHRCRLPPCSCIKPPPPLASSRRPTQGRLLPGRPTTSFHELGSRPSGSLLHKP